METTSDHETYAGDLDTRALIFAAQEGCSDAFGTLWSRFGDVAFNSAARIVGPAAAEDIAQDAAVKMLRTIHTLDMDKPYEHSPNMSPETRVSSWLGRIASNLAIDSYRRKERIQMNSRDFQDGTYHSDVETSPYAPHLDTPDEVYDGLPEHALNLLQGVNPRFQKEVYLSDIEGMEQEEIAEILGIKVGTVKSRVHRGRKQLRAICRPTPSDEA